MPDAILKPLTPEDLEAVISIDMATGGVSRRGYFEKRLVAATEGPADYVYVGLHVGGQLAGFAFAKMVSGEFGQSDVSASLDAIGVDPTHNAKGYGHRLLEEVEKILRHKGVSTLMSQINWSQPEVHGFFAHAGFELAPRLVLTRPTDRIVLELDERETEEDPDGPDYSSPNGDAENALSHERIPVRNLRAGDLDKIVDIDKSTTGTERHAYFTRKLHEILYQSGVQVSLVAEQDSFVTGFIMARVDYGEFGHTSREAVLDALGVDPGFQGQGIGQELMARIMANLSALAVEQVRTEVAWNDTALIEFFSTTGFKPAQRVTLCKTL